MGGGGVGFEPVKNIGGLESAAVSDTVVSSIAKGGLYGVGTLVDGMDMGSAGGGGVDGEAADKGEAVQDDGA